MPKQLFAVIVVSVMLSTAIGFAFGSVKNPPAAAASTSTQIVTQLKAVNAKLQTLNTRVGDTSTSDGTVRGLLTIICDYTASISCK
ncbi:MAG: hypothetical protein WKF96_03005 [Solirubrobacteraceae bacterium]